MYVFSAVEMRKSLCRETTIKNTVRYTELYKCLIKI